MTDEEIVVFVNACGDKLDDEAVTLSDLEKVAALVSSVDFEIALGGLAGFYNNSAGNNTLATVEALRTIGANDGANALFRSILLFPDPARIVERRYCQEHLLNLSNGFRNEEGNYEKQNPCVWELLVLYVKASIGR